MTFFNRLSITVLGLIYSASSLAGGGGTLVYAPVLNPASSNPIPTLSGTMLIVLSLLLVAIAFRISQKNQSNTFMTMLIGVLGTSAILSASGGIKIISDVYADSGTGNEFLIALSSSTGGQVSIPASSISIYENTSGVNQRITQINLTNNCPNTDVGLIEGVSRCSVGAIVPTSMEGLCYVNCLPQEQEAR